MTPSECPTSNTTASGASAYLEQGSLLLHFAQRSRFDALADHFGRLLDVDEAILDGEVIAVDESGDRSSTSCSACSERPLRGFRYPLG